MSKVSVIIPAFNEQARIPNVLRALENHPLVWETIVVDDCSVDKTAEAVAKFPSAKLIRLSKNGGKSKAVATGIKASNGDIVCLLDADLVNLAASDITNLISPVISGLADISISYRKQNVWFDRMVGFDFISGERVYHKTFIQDHLDEITRLPAFGLEVFTNKLIIAQKARIKIVPFISAYSPLKYQKSGTWAGVKSDFHMAADILGTISLFAIIGQLLAMSRLRIK
jgi:glycosyltransferase involved in cell wall biosynthesis